tara:strand:- start:155 stop:571 length:417 start_codon:yes stop_codon:yes gene_type:complete
MINFEKVIPNKKQIKELYHLLTNRRYSISHQNLPSFEEHSKFVSKNPYLVWYLIYKNFELLGSTYIQKDNSVGIDLKLPNKEDVIEISSYIKKNHLPLKPVKSLRRGDFFVNISPFDKELIEIFKKLNQKEIQRSFLI